MSRLLAARPDLRLSISATTRRARPVEVEGRDYYFVDPDGTTLRVGYVDADPNAAEVVRFHDEDDLGEVPRLPPVEPATALARLQRLEPWMPGVNEPQRIA